VYFVVYQVRDVVLLVFIVNVGVVVVQGRHGELEQRAQVKRILGRLVEDEALLKVALVEHEWQAWFFDKKLKQKLFKQ
jgi:hypothetical protein